MALVSLVLPMDEFSAAPEEARIADYRRALEAAGYDVELILAAGPGLEPEVPAGARLVRVADSGRAAAAVAGLDSADGEFLLVLDHDSGYEPEDLVRVVETLKNGEANLAIASHRSNGGSSPVTIGRFGRGLGALARLLTGTSDPLSGLVGLTCAARDQARGEFMAIGSQFALELLAKVKGRRTDVPIGRLSNRSRRRPEWNDLRHLKRLADHRFGNFSRLIQFCAVGASGMVVDLSSYASFQWLMARTGLAGVEWPGIGPLDLAMAGFLAVGLALCWNFSLNRRLTFSYARHGSLLRQFVAYVSVNAVAISVNLALRLTLPRYFAFFEAHKLAAAVVGIVLATGLSFSMSRWLVFSHRASQKPGDRPARRADTTLAESTAAP